jgi:hypothetical protein
MNLVIARNEDESGTTVGKKGSCMPAAAVDINSATLPPVKHGLFLLEFCCSKGGGGDEARGTEATLFTSLDLGFTAGNSYDFCSSSYGSSGIGMKEGFVFNQQRDAVVISARYKL